MSGFIGTGTSPGPLESFNGHTLAWARPADGGPTTITIAVATHNLPTDSGSAPPFSAAMPPSYVPLLNAAEEVWESVADIRFVPVADDATSFVNAADIRAGVAALAPALGFIGYTRMGFEANGDFLPDTIVTVDDPASEPVQALPDGDLQYVGFETTVFQDFIHELGHALGLAHNLNDPAAIMYPVLSANNPLPGAQDIAAIQSVYGAPTTPLLLSQNDSATLHSLAPSAFPVA